MPAETAGRTPDAVRRHYLIERELADRLRRAPPDERARLYRDVYDELFRRVPDHPQHERAADAASRSRAVRSQARYLARYLSPGAHVLEIGAGDCALSRLVAGRVRRVTAIDVATEIVPDDLPANVEVRLTDGTSIPASDVDVAFSNQLMEHLHPDDAQRQLRNIHAALRPGGRYVCITPNQLVGPHDVSMPFDDVATGFHLHEYANGELAALMRAVGFRRVVGIVPVGSRAIEYPVWLVWLVERVLGRVPARWRKRAPGTLKRLMNVRLVATR